MPVVTRFDEPFPRAVRATANDADMMGPHHDRADLRPASIRTDARPIARQIEPWIGGAEHVPHIGAAPRAAVAGVMPAVDRRLRAVMIIMMRRQRRRIQASAIAATNNRRILISNF